MFKLLSDAKSLNAGITAALAMYQKTFEKLHVVTVSAIWHACKHGDPSYLNRIYPTLNSNDQTALRQYIRRIHAINGLKGGKPDGMPAEIVSAAVLAGSVLGFEKGAFTVIRGHTSPEAKALAELCDSRFLNPDGETDKMVFARNNFAEVKTLGDVELIDALVKKIKEADTDTETRKSNVSASTKSFLAAMRDQLIQRKNQLTLAEG